MTIEEALYTARQFVNCCRAQKKDCRSIYGSCFKCEHNYDVAAHIDSIEMICERLTPKKAIIEDERNVFCPNCHGRLSDVFVFGDVSEEDITHCCICGQAIKQETDWEYDEWN